MKFGIAFVTESAAKFASDVTVVANFLVCVFVKGCVAFGTVCACFKIFFLLWGEKHGLSCHFVIVSVLCLCCFIEVAEKTHYTVISAPRLDVSRVLSLCCKL